jgi:hypothetical protein
MLEVNIEYFGQFLNVRPTLAQLLIDRLSETTDLSLLLPSDLSTASI